MFVVGSFVTIKIDQKNKNEMKYRLLRKTYISWGVNFLVFVVKLNLKFRTTTKYEPSK